MRWLDKLDRRFGNIAIKNLMLYIVAITGAVFLLAKVDVRVLSIIYLDPGLVMQGEVWRLITFIFIPPTFSVIWIIFALYFYYMIGNSLDREWGSFKFNVYYLIGMIGTTIAAFITGGGTGLYLNTSLFLAFARLFPEYQILLFFVLPVKVKYLAWLNWAFIGYTVLTQPLPFKVAALVSVLNFFVFFGKDIVLDLKNRRRTHYNRKAFVSKFPTRDWIHKCTVCGRTEKDVPNMDFRYCVDCAGDYEYCWDHLHQHEHVKGEK